MRNSFIKTILPTVIIGSVVTSLALNGLPSGSGMDKAEAAAASSASLSFSKFLENNAPKRTLRSVSGINTVTNLSSTVVLVNKQRNLPSNYVPQDLVVPQVPFSFSGPSPKSR